MPKTFLLVEDDAHDAALLKLALKAESADIHLQIVNNGVDATLYLKGEARFAPRHKFPLPRVILLDIQMPLFDGFEFLTWLRNEAPVPQRQIPVVVMSGSDRRKDIDRAYDLGANAYLIKPQAWSEFKQRLRGMASFWSRANPRPAFADLKISQPKGGKALLRVHRQIKRPLFTPGRSESPQPCAHVNLGKLFFPKYPPNRQRKEMRNLILALAFSLILCAILGAAFYLINQQGHH